MDVNYGARCIFCEGCSFASTFSFPQVAKRGENDSRTWTRPGRWRKPASSDGIMRGPRIPRGSPPIRSMRSAEPRKPRHSGSGMGIGAEETKALVTPCARA
jgi:hypothetical protein